MTAKIRILLVDDEPQLVRAMERVLRARREEWTVRTAGSGESALALLAVEPAEIVVSDIRMPGMDGAELLRRVKELYPKVVMIVLSGESTEEAAARARLLTDRVLQKPITSRSFLEAIQSAADTLLQGTA